MRTAQEQEQLTPARWALAVVTVLTYLLVLSLAPLTAAERASVTVLWVGWVVLSGWFELRRERLPGRTAVMDVATAGIGAVTLAVAPGLWPLALGIALLHVVSATLRGGLAVGVPALLLAEVSLLAAAGAHGLLVGDWGFLAVAHALVGLTMVSTLSTALGDRDKVESDRHRIDEALTAFGQVAVEATPAEAVQAAVVHLLADGEVLDVAVRTQDDEGWEPPTVDTERRVRLVRGPAGGLVRQVWVPMVAGHDIVGDVTIQLRTEPCDADVRALDQLADRLAVAVLAQSAHRNERRARLELERAETVRDEVLARVTHDLRAPLSTITGSVFTLLEHGDQLDEANTRMLYELLGRNADRVTNWVQSLLEGAMLGERRELAVEPTDLRTLLRDGAETATQHLSNHELVVDAPDLEVVADPVAVTRVLSNLLGNAAKYAPAGSRVELTARVRGDEILIAVADHGTGMTPEAAAHVFEPFYRAPDQPAGVHGTGLGLATVRDLVLSWGGRVGVGETPGGGATFWFTIPTRRDGDRTAEVVDLRPASGD